jgi:hypothetical protein
MLIFLAAMGKPIIFVSCGQVTKAEKDLGTAIAKTAHAITGFDAFFAEQVHDLNGLNENILGALRDCVGLILVLHPRGTVIHPDKTSHIRASVWIEQEIAIAAYIQSMGNPLPVIAFIHESIDLEGIRSLLHLNPIKFANEFEVLSALPRLLENWKNLSPRGIQIELKSERSNVQQGHPIRRLNVMLVNNSNERISTFDGYVRVPTDILKHWSGTNWGEEPSGDPACRQFHLSEKNSGQLLPQTSTRLHSLEYCLPCAVEAANGSEAVVLSATAQAKVWIDKREYSDEKTMLVLSSAD